MRGRCGTGGRRAAGGDVTRGRRRWIWKRVLLRAMQHHRLVDEDEIVPAPAPAAACEQRTSTASSLSEADMYAEAARVVKEGNKRNVWPAIAAALVSGLICVAWVLVALHIYHGVHALATLDTPHTLGEPVGGA